MLFISKTVFLTANQTAMKHILNLFLVFSSITIFSCQSLYAFDRQAFRKEFLKAQRFLKSNSDSCRYYLDRAMPLTASDADTSFLAIGLIYYVEGRLYMQKHEFDKAQSILDEALTIFEELNELEKIGDTYSVKGNVSRYANDIPQSNMYFKKAIKIAEEIKDTFGMAISYNNIASNYIFTGDYSTAIETYYKGLDLCEKIGCPNVPYFLGDIGSVHFEQKEYQKAADLTLKAIQLSDNDLRNKTNYLYNLSHIYAEMAKRDSCIYYLDLAYHYSKSQNWKSLEADCINAYAKIKRDDEQYKDALNLYKQQIELYKLINPEPRKVVELYTSIAQIQTKLNKFSAAEKRLAAAEKQAKQLKLYSFTPTIYETYTDLYIAKNDYRNAFSYLQKLKLAEDSLFTLEKSKQIAELEVKYNTAQKDKEIATERANVLEAECYLKEEQTAKREQRNLYLSLLGVALFGITILYLINRNRRLKNDNLEQENEFLLRESKQQERNLSILKEKNVALDNLNTIIKKQKAILEKENINLDESYTALIEQSKMESTTVVIKDNSKPPKEFQCEYDTILYVTSDEEKSNNRKILYEVYNKNNKSVVKTVSLRMTNDDFIRQLPKRPFAKINRKNVVNLLQIKQYDGKHKTGKVTMSNNQVLKVSPNYKETFDTIYGRYKGNR